LYAEKHTENNENSLLFCFSQFRDSNLKTQLEAKGYRVTDSFSKKCDYLIVENKNKETGKMKNAVKWQKEILTKQEVINKFL